MYHFTKRLFTATLLLISQLLVAQTFSSEPQARFEENKGQWNPAVLYRTELNNGFIYHERGGYTVHFSNLSDVYEEFQHSGTDAGDLQQLFKPEQMAVIRFHVLTSMIGE
jgi:hypothetical protein